MSICPEAGQVFQNTCTPCLACKIILFLISGNNIKSLFIWLKTSLFPLYYAGHSGAASTRQTSLAISGRGLMCLLMTQRGLNMPVIQSTSNLDQLPDIKLRNRLVSQICSSVPTLPQYHLFPCTP